MVWWASSDKLCALRGCACRQAGKELAGKLATAQCCGSKTGSKTGCSKWAAAAGQGAHGVGPCSLWVVDLGGAAQGGYY